MIFHRMIPVSGCPPGAGKPTTLTMRDTTLVAFIEDPDGERHLATYTIKIPGTSE